MADGCTEVCDCDGGAVECVDLQCHDVAQCGQIPNTNEYGCYCPAGWIGDGLQCVGMSALSDISNSIELLQFVYFFQLYYILPNRSNTCFVPMASPDAKILTFCVANISYITPMHMFPFWCTQLKANDIYI